VKFLIGLILISQAFAQEDELSKAFNKRTEKDCVRLLSEIRKRTRITAELKDKIEKVKLGKNKDSKFALLYLKLNNEQLCSEQPSRTELGTVYIQYICRDKNGKITFDKNINGGPSDCSGDSPKFH
jgi:hypothetical protein